MRVVIIRHGIAEDRDVWAKTGKSDDLRPLTDEGAKKVKKMARGLMLEVPQLLAIASSPLTRAWETAHLVGEVYNKRGPEALKALAPEGDPVQILDWINGFEGGAVALVGHEPDLGELVGWLCTGKTGTGPTFKKGGVALVEFETARTASTASLRWLMYPGHLRALGRPRLEPPN